MMIFPKSVTRPITEPVIMSATTGTPSGAAPFLTTSEPSPAAWVTASVAAGATRAAQAAENEG